MFNKQAVLLWRSKGTSLNFISTRAIAVVKNLLLSPQGDYCACGVSLCEVATTFPNKPLVEQGTQAGYRHTDISGNMNMTTVSFTSFPAFLICRNIGLTVYLQILKFFLLKEKNNFFLFHHLFILQYEHLLIYCMHGSTSKAMHYILKFK